MLCGSGRHGAFMTDQKDDPKCVWHRNLNGEFNDFRRRHPGVSSLMGLVRAIVAATATPPTARPSAPSVSDTARFPALLVKKASVAPWATLVRTQAPPVAAGSELPASALKAQVESSTAAAAAAAGVSGEDARGAAKSSGTKVTPSSPPPSIREGMVEVLTMDKAELLERDSTEEDKAKEEVEEDAKREEEEEKDDDNDDDDDDNDETEEVVIQLNSTKADRHDGRREEIVLKLDQRHLLGSSSHATVYRALRRFLVETEVAVKMWDLPVDSKKREKVGDDLKREVDSIRKLGGDVCVNFITYHKDKRLGPGKRVAILVMELCRQSLAEYIQDSSSGGATGALKDPGLWRHHLRSIVHQLLVAYDKCHRANICHRDVKPENILISKDSRRDGSPLVKLCDFAFSRYFEMGQSSVDKVHQRCWMAPEVDFDTGGRYKKNSDLWSLGCVIHFVATKGEALFRTPRERDDTRHRTDYLHRANVHVTHPLLFDLIDAMTQADPGARITVESALAHPATWSSERVGTFLCDLANAFNQGKARSFQHAIDVEARLIVPTATGWPSCRACGPTR